MLAHKAQGQGKGLFGVNTLKIEAEEICSNSDRSCTLLPFSFYVTVFTVCMVH